MTRPTPLTLRALACAAAGLLAVLATLWWSSSSAKPLAAGKPRAAEIPVPVSIAPVTEGSLTVLLDALGSVVPANSVLVRPRVDGQLLRVHFREGQQVKAGQLLAEIDPRPFEVIQTQARGQLTKEQAQLTHARLDLVRYRGLWQQDSIARQVLDAQEALVQQYQGQVESSQGQLDDARLQLDYARVTAPIDGLVGLRQVDPGNLVQASDSTGLVRITQLQPIHVLFTLAEDALPDILPKLNSGEGLRVVAYDRSLRKRLGEGKLLSIDNQIDVSSGTFKLKAEFANADGALFPNQFVNIKLQLETLERVTLVSSAAIQHGVQGDFVYALDAQARVRLQPVLVGRQEANQIVVEQGLAAGERVVVDGIDRLRAGILVAPQLDDRTVQTALAAPALSATP